MERIDEYYGVWNNVKMCTVKHNHNTHHTQTLPLFNCKTLVHLSLTRCQAIVESGTVCMPSLKKLHLCGVDVGESLHHFLSGCQVLQELFIQDVSNTRSNSRCLSISSPTIKSLTVEYPIIRLKDAFERKNVCWVVKINAPALTYLKIHDCRGIGVSVLPITSSFIHEADIRFRRFARNGDYIPSEVDFLDYLCNADCLRLSGYIDITKSSSSIVRFDNLTKLELDLTVDCPSLVKLLDSADNLQVLIVDLNLAFWEDPKRVPKCLSLHLKTIRTGTIVCGKHEFNMLIYFARNAKVLEMMDLRSANCTKARFNVIRRILLMKRELDVCVLPMEREWADL